jgi:hypothetical protein
MDGPARLVVAAAPFVAAGVLASGWVEGPLVLAGAVLFAAAGLFAGLEIGRWGALGLVLAGPLLVGAGWFGTLGAGMVGGVLFGTSGYVAGAGSSDYRVAYGGAYLALALILVAGALAVLRERRPPIP